MSVQGSLDTFALPEVLMFLAATKKSGELHLAGNRSLGLAAVPALEGRLWFDDGHLVATEVGTTSEPVDAVLELLWLVEGTFVFQPGAARAHRMAVDVGAVVAGAQARAAEWRRIAELVPSRGAWLYLTAELVDSDVTLRADEWRLAVAVAGGCSVGATVERLGLADLPAFRAVKEMVEAGLVIVCADGPPPEPLVPRPARDVERRRPRRSPSPPTISFDPAVTTRARSR